MQKKILFLVPELFTGKGGIQVYNSDLLKAMTELGYEVSVVSKNDLKGTGNKLYSFNYSKGRKTLFILSTLKQILKFKPDIILCGHVNFSPLCYLVSKFFKKKFIVLTYGIDVWSLAQGTKIKAIKAAHLIISISNYTKNRLVEQIPEIKDKVKLLHNSIDSSKFYPKPKPEYLMEKLNINAEDKVVLTIARLSSIEKYKGYDKVLLAFSHLLNLSTSQLPDFKYILGGSGDDIERIKRLIKDHGLEDKVILTGFIPENELIDYYNLCDVFIMPSKFEGFGFVFIEALACGKPVIAGNKDGSRDALLDGELGILIDPDNPEEIEHAIINVFKGEVNKKLLDREYLRERVIEEYGVNRFRERVEVLIGAIIQ